MAKPVKKKAVRKPKSKANDREIVEKRAKAYADMEPHLCDVVRMGEIATSLFDCSDQGRFVRGDPPGGNAPRSPAALLRLGLPAMKRRRRSVTKRNRQWIAAHARRLKR
jgi:hypothetical protein